MLRHQRLYLNTVNKYLASVALAAAGLALSLALEIAGSPNFTIGFFLAVVATYYVAGVGSAIFCYILSVLGLVFLSLPTISIFDTTSYADWMQLDVTTIVIVIVCWLLWRLRMAHEREAYHIQELQTAQRQSAHATPCDRLVASTLQYAYVPPLPDRIDHCSVATIYESGSIVAGGDFYDVFKLRNGKIAIIIGNVSSRGVEATGQAVVAKYTLRFGLEENGQPSYCLRQLNNLLSRDPQFSGFVTIFCGVIDPIAKTITYCTGGHEPPILYTASCETIKQLKPTGQAVGYEVEGHFDDDTVDFRAMDRILLFTEGLSGAKGQRGILGVDGLIQIVCEEKTENPQDSLHRIFDSVKAYNQGQLRDDAAAVLVMMMD